MSLKKQAISGVFWSSLQQFSSQIIGFIVSIILARLLLPSEFGLIAMIGIFMGIGAVLMDAGLTQSLIRTTNPTQEDFSTVFFFNLFGSIIIYIFFFFTAPYIADFYNQQILTQIIRSYCIIFIINAFSSVQFTRLTKKMDFKTEMKVTVPSLIIGAITGISLALAGFGVWSLVICAIVQSLASTVQLWYWSKWKPTWGFNKEIFKNHFHFGYKLTLSALLDMIFNNIYVIIIGKFFAPAQVGFFNRADSLKQFPVHNVSVILNKITFPLFAQIKDDDIRLKEIYKKIMQMVIYIIAPTLFFMAILAEPLFRFLFTEKWLPAVPYFQILCANGLLYPIHSYNLNILKVKGRSDLFLKLEIIKKILIVIMVLISFQYGIFGLLYGSVIFSVVAFFINTHYTGKYLNYTAWSQMKDLLPIIFLAAFCGFLVFIMDFFTKQFFHFDILRIIFCGFSGTFLYFCLSYSFKMSSLFELISIIKRK